MRHLLFVFGCGVLLVSAWLLSLQAPSPLQAQAIHKEEIDRVQVIVQLDISQIRVPYMRGATAEQARQVQIDLAQHEVVKAISDDMAVEHHYQSVPFSLFTVPRGELATLKGTTGVAAIFENGLLFQSLDTSTPAIGMDTVWESGYEGVGQTVVILDTGIQANHEFFGGRVVAEACFSASLGTYSGTLPFAQATSTSTHSMCPSEAGVQYGVGAADPQIPTCLKSNGSQMCHHGTHVAGIAAGGDVSPIYDGVARGANIVGMQVFTRFNDCAPFERSSPCLSAFYSDLVAALDYVHTSLQYSYTIAAVNMSLGGDAYDDQAGCDSDLPFLKAMIDQLRADGIATVIASGNDGYTSTLSAPACISTAVAVGSVYDLNGISPFSNSDEMVDLLAPGSWIRASYAHGGYGGFHGTSMAAPHVAGAWAIGREISPTISVTDLLTVFIDTGLLISDTRPNGQHTKPLIQVDEMMAAIAPPAEFVLGKANISSTLAVGAQITHFVPITNNGGVGLVWDAAVCDGSSSWLTLSPSVPMTTAHEMADLLSINFAVDSEPLGTYTETVCIHSSTGITIEITAALTITSAELADDAPTIEAALSEGSGMIYWLDYVASPCTADMVRSPSNPFGRFTTWQADVNNHVDITADLNSPDINYYYYLLLDCGTTLAPSDVVGEFDFNLVGGD